MAQTRSRAKAPRGYTGPVDAQVWEVLEKAWEEGVAVSSNFARAYAPYLALAASLGWVSTVTLDGQGYLGIWNITAEGVSAYEHKDLR